MAKNNYFIVNRSIVKHWVWDDKPFSKGQAWIDMIRMANSQDKKIPYKGELVVVKRGSFITSLAKLSEKWGWSINKTRLFITHLKNDEMLVSIKVSIKDNKKHRYILTNYEDFQFSPHDKGIDKGIDKGMGKGMGKGHKQISIKEEELNKISLSEVINLWNEIMGKKVRVTDGRREKFNTRIKEWKDLATIKKILDKIKASSFCMGKTGWKADIDWLLDNDTNWVKVIEGKYDDQEESKRTPQENEDIKTAYRCAGRNPGCTKGEERVCKVCPNKIARKERMKL